MVDQIFLMWLIFCMTHAKLSFVMLFHLQSTASIKFMKKKNIHEEEEIHEGYDVLQRETFAKVDD